MSRGKFTPTIREWLGFAVWIVVVGAVIYGAIMWRDRVLHTQPAEMVVPPAPSIARAETTIPRRSVAAAALGYAFVRPMPVVPPPAPRDYDFYTLEPAGRDGDGHPVYDRHGYYGAECVNPYLDRGIILSEFQEHYRAPKSGCGPTAVLDWVIWYQNTGLVPRSTRTSDLGAYKRATFDLIDRKIAELRGAYRTDAGGANTNEIIVAFDHLISELSQGRVRLQCEIRDAPLALQDLLQETHFYRAGILLVQVYDPRAPPWGGYHAVTLVRTDTTGRVSIANWGRYQHGRLIERGGEQWFASEDGAPVIFKVKSLLTFTPFRPTGE